MSPETIFAEHLQGDGLRQADIDRFRFQGVPAMALVHPSIVLRHRVVFSRGGFEFERHRADEDAVGAFVFAIYDVYGELADLCAWRPPTTIATWLGSVSLLGEEHVFEPRMGDPLRVHASPLDWLRADRGGVVVIDTGRAAPLLRDAGSLVVDSVEHGRLLRKALTLPAPEILVDLKEARAA